MNNIYRIIDIDKNGVNSVYIFYKDDSVEESHILLQNTEEKTKYKEQIGLKNYESVIDSDINVHIINMNINHDDSISVIKRKIIHAFKNSISIDEIYIFALREKIINNFEMFEILSQNDNLDISRDRFIQYLLNFYDINDDILEQLVSKEEITYDDVLSLNLDGKTKLMQMPLGIKYFVENNYPIAVNPFEIQKIDKFLELNGGDIINTENKKLLLDYPNIYENNIYLCRAYNALEITETKEITEESIIKLYYPFLYEKDINNKTLLDENIASLIDSNTALLNTSFYNNVDNVQLLKDVFNNKKSELDYINKGIKEVSFTISQSYKVILPLELVFKLLKTSEDMPFIKYNPGKGREKMYRLYANKNSTNGKKIPYLQKSALMKLRMNLAREKGVEVYFQNLKDEYTITMYFNEYGEINVNFKTDKYISFDEINSILRDTINDKTLVIYNYLNQRGYKFEVFENLLHYNIEIKRILYMMKLNIKRNIKFSKYIGCYSTFVSVVNDDLKSGIFMRYKRVSDFEKMDSIDAFITELLIANKSQLEILDELEKNYDLTREEAEEKLVYKFNELKTEQQRHENRKLKIKSNPGFPISIMKEKFTNNIDISIDNINNVKYIDVIPMYIDSMIRLTQNISSTSVKKDKINKLCGIKKIIEEDEIEEIESKIVEDLKSNIGFDITTGSIESADLDDDEGVLGLLGDLEEADEEDDDEYMVGGADLDDKFIIATSPSETSASSSEKTTKTTVTSQTESDGDALEFEIADDISEGSELNTEISKEISKEITIDDKDTIPSDKVQLEEIEDTIYDKPSDEKVVIDNEVEDDDEILIKDVAGLKLTNPNPFFEKMYKRDPKLFLTKKDGKFKAYSRICPSNLRRQPVILTDKEKKRIDDKDAKSGVKSYHHESAIKYGSSESTKHWYICPRYWCMRDNVSLTEDEVKAGKCGGKIIPRDASKVPKDAFIYEFNADAEHLDENGKYIEHYPGFQKQDAHPDGLCIPCCFKDWDSPSQKKRRDICLKNEAETDIKQEHDDYVKGIDKFPLAKGRLGKLPISIEKILNIRGNKFFNKRDGNQWTMLRQGVEVNKNQSFIGILADVYSSMSLDKKESVTAPPSIKEMKQIIINALDLDNFITYNNGSLVNLFKKNTLSVNIQKYSDTELYNKVDVRKTEVKNYLRDVIGAYENFIDYLKDDNIVIDHTFLWDIVTKKNDLLFNKGLNLIILEITDNDITDNVQIICPTNSYSNEVFNANKHSVIIMKKEDFYEPIYLYHMVENVYSEPKRLFSEKDSTLLSNIKSLFNLIKKANNQCLPKLSRPKVYKFKTNKTLINVINILKKIKYTVTQQIVNYNNKVVGVYIEQGENKGYIPIEPSSIIKDIEYTFIDNVDIWDDLPDVVQFLNNISIKTKNELPCKPKVKIVDDGKIVGILTETNQFVPISNPVDNIMSNGNEAFRDMETQEGTNYMLSDVETLIQDTQDNKRIEVVNKIKLETNLYNAFRNTARIILNKYENIKVRKELENILKNVTILYTEKLINIRTLLISLLKDHMYFSADLNDNEELLLELSDITNCLDSTTCKDKQFCFSSGTQKQCKLIIPERHLLSNNNNETIYFNRLADELIRYGLIKNYMFKPKVFLSIDNLDYNLDEEEIILLDSILSKGYFDDLTESYDNKYISNTIMEFIQPSQTQKYDMTFTEQELLKGKRVSSTQSKITENCIYKTDKIFGKWSNFFDNDNVEKYYKNNIQCNYQIIIDIINEYIDTQITVDEIKQVLTFELSELVKKTEDGVNKILRQILKDQGKDILIKQMLEQGNSISNLINSSNYYLTNLDLILLGMHYNLPLILISSRSLQELKGWSLKGRNAKLETDSGDRLTKLLRKMWIVNKSTTKTASRYYFIRVGTIKANVVPQYNIISNKDSFGIPVVELTPKMKKTIAQYKSRPSLDNYIKHYKTKTQIKEVQSPANKVDETVKTPQLLGTTVKLQMDGIEEIEEKKDE